MSDQQFGFITGTNTNKAAVLAQNITSYSISHGLPVFVCSLNAQGFFDAMLQDVIFYKAMGANPND